MTLEELRAMYSLVERETRALDVLRSEFSMEHAKYLATAKAPLGHDVDLWGDGKIKPTEACTLNRKP